MGEFLLAKAFTPALSFISDGWSQEPGGSSVPSSSPPSQTRNSSSQHGPSFILAASEELCLLDV